MPPNSNRLLLKWGLGPFIASNVVEPGSISFRRWKDGDVIGYTKLVPEFQENFAAPYYVIHRAHFHDALFQLASYLGVEIKLDSRVVDYDDETPSITLHNGETLTADLIIGVDGKPALSLATLTWTSLTRMKESSLSPGAGFLVASTNRR